MKFNHRVVTFVSVLLYYSCKRHVMGDCILSKINFPTKTNVALPKHRLPISASQKPVLELK